jgi:hypothetical protein
MIRQCLKKPNLYGFVIFLPLIAILPQALIDSQFAILPIALIPTSKKEHCQSAMLFHSIFLK